MKALRTFRLSTPLLLAAALAACQANIKDDLTVRASRELTVMADSVLSGPDVAFYADSSLTVHISGDTALHLQPAPGAPVLRSGSPLLDAAFAVGVSSLREITGDPFLAARLLPLADPDSARVLVMYKLRGLLSPDSSSGWPLVDESPRWVAAAARIALCLGDTALGSTLLSDGALLLEQCLRVRKNTRAGLIQGTPVCASPYIAVPRWMNSVQAYECLTLADNAAAVSAYRGLAACAAALGSPDSSLFSEHAAGIASKINLLLWQPDLGRYSQYLYNPVYPIQSPVADNLSSALAILADIPTPEMADRILDSTPWLPQGMPSLFPTVSGTPPLGLEDMAPEVQLAWAFAAATRGNAPVLDAAVASLLARSFGKFGHPEATAAVATLAIGIFAGLTPTPDGLDFHPVMPSYLRGSLTLSGVNYRGASLDIKINGTGNRIAKFTIDGNETACYKVNPTITGHHTVEIFMANNNLSSMELPESRQQWTLPTPEVRWLGARTGYIDDKLPGASCRLIINGSYDGLTTNKEIRLSLPQAFSTAAVRFAYTGLKDSRQTFPLSAYTSSPHELYSSRSVITVQAEDAAVTGTTLVRDWRLARRFAENSAGHQPTITFTVSAPQAGEYILRLCYSNGAGPAATSTAIRALTVNGSYAGSFVLPSKGTGWWLSTTVSNTLTASLHKGENLVTVSMPPGSGVPILIDYLTAIRL